MTKRGLDEVRNLVQQRNGTAIIPRSSRQSGKIHELIVNRGRLLDFMDRLSFEALVASTPDNVSYLADIPRLPGVMDTLDIHVVMFREKDREPAIIMPAVSIDQYARSESLIKDVRIYNEFYYYKADPLDYNRLSEPERKVANIFFNQEISKSILESVGQVLRERGVTTGEVGFDENGVPPPRLEEFVKMNPGLSIRPASSIFKQIRMVKTPEEIQRIRKAVEATERGIQAVFDVAKPGAVNRQLQFVFQTTIMKEGCTPYFAVIAGGTEGALVNYLPSDYVLRSGDPIRMDCNACCKNYVSDVGRNASVGQPSEKAKRIFGALLKGKEEMEIAIRPGVRATQVFKTAVSAVQTGGMPNYKRKFVGHSLGLQVVEPPLLQPGDETEIEENMVLAIETPYYEIGFGSFNPEDTVVVTRNGCERLSKTENRLYVV